MKYFFSAFFLVLIFSAKAQDFSIKGKVIDQSTKTSLESATVYIEKAKDSSLISYTITDKDGLFDVKGRAYTDLLRVNISYVGFDTYVKEIPVDSIAIDFGIITLRPASNTLNEVVVKSRAPVTIKKDTLEFNVASFKTRKDATVEDLLKQLPGVEVDENGKIKVNGKEVNQILVNGKPFFGDDPTIATKNLTKEIIEKIQVVDTKSKADAFAGKEGDKENKTINLTIKEENNKGTFGRISGGGGTDERYEYAGIVNRFDNERRLSILGGGNNINSPGFSFGEITKMFGNASSISVSSGGSFTIDGRSFGAGDGIVDSRNIGANYADELSEQLDVSADYFYSGANSFNETTVERENILPDFRFFTNTNSRSENTTDNHDINGLLEVEIDTTFLITIEPSVQRSLSTSDFSSQGESLDETENLINTSTRSNRSNNESTSFSNDFEAVKRFGKDGAFLKFFAATNYTQGEGTERFSNEVLFFDGSQEDISRNQFVEEDRDESSVRTRLTYRYPILSKKLFLDMQYQYSQDERTNLRSAFEFDETTMDFTDFQEELSSDFVSANTVHRPGLDLTYSADGVNLSLEGGYVLRNLENEDFLRPDLSIQEDFTAVELGASAWKKLSNKANINLGYNLQNAAPTLNQLQPFVNVNDPLNVVQGNPDLNPTNTHSLYLSYNKYDFQKGNNFYSYLNANVVNDQVVTRTTVDQDLVRTTTYENVDGTYRLSGSFSFGRKFKVDSLKSIRARLGLWSNVNQNVNFNNEVQYKSNRIGLNPTINITYEWSKVLQFTTRYRYSYTQTRFDLDTFDNQNFASHEIKLTTATFLPKNLEWRNDVVYSYNPNVAQDFQREAYFWNSTLAYTFYKDKLTATLKVYDILNQNTNAARTANENFIQDTVSTVLRQYAMFSLSYKFNTLGSKGESGANPFFFF